MRATPHRTLARSWGRPLVRILLAASLGAGSGVASAWGQGADTGPEPGIEGLRWMAGQWSGEESGVAMEETWLAPSGGIMIGLHRDVFSPDRAFFEFLRIEASDSGIVYLAQPLGRPATAFPLVEMSESRAVFENPAHDFPQRITYSRTENVLRARVDGVQDGVEKSQEWAWKGKE